MVAARYHGPAAELTLESLAVPRPGPGEALLRVLAAGLCHTDLQFLDGAINYGVIPVTLGHEIAGEVTELGAGVTRFQAGERVVGSYPSPCGECHWCATGQGQICPNAGPQIGFSADGGFAEFVKVPARNLVRSPSGLGAAEAAVMACSGASAYHAIVGIGGPKAGDTVVVYGVGGVGLMAIQLARLAGARPIALGRSAAKLALAAELGAEPAIDVQRQDPVGAVFATTGGEGADIVLDLVGTRAAMADALAMLRRRGRLVCFGYSGEHLEVDPLRLLLKELQIRSAVGNTVEELKAVLALAAEGRIKPIIADRRPLGAINQAIAQLRRGEVAGRIVFEPDAARRPEPIGSAHMHELEAELLAFIGGGIDSPGDPAEFDALALRLFEYQFRCNAPYRTFCQRRGRTPDGVSHWREIPPVPIAAFKHAELVCESPARAVACFRSSGTTNPGQRSQHFHPSLAVYDLNATLNFAAHLLPDHSRLPFAVLFPPPGELPHSSLAYWLGLMVRRFGEPGSDWFIRDDRLDAEALASTLHRWEREGRAAGLLAASFSLVHFLEYCEGRGERFQLPPGSRLMDTGGYKGRSRELPRDQLYERAGATFGVPGDCIVNMYGMTEHSTQFLDAVLRNRMRRVDGPRYKTIPPWVRTLVVDPGTLEPLPAGETGLLLHYDLANRASVLAVLSEDLGYRVGEGFELVGRVGGAEARGCSIAIDELLTRTTE